MFPRMNSVKTDWRSSLIRDCLDTLLRISEDGPSLEDFNPDTGMDRWHAGKVRSLNSSPNKRKRTNDGKQVADLATLTLSDVEMKVKKKIDIYN